LIGHWFLVFGFWKERVRRHGLLVWQRAMDLAVGIYGLIRNFPVEERFSLADQMRRCAVSIPSNIAEGAARASKREFVQYLYIALGSASELDTQIQIAQRVGYIEDVTAHREAILVIKKMINALITSLKRQ
jgi:four helix bundle protein